MSGRPISEFYGASAGKLLQFEAAYASRNIVALWDGVLDVMVIGGHGSGGVITSFNNGFVTGASTGECAAAISIPVSRGDTLIATIGAGGAAVTGSGTSRVPGNNGNDTTVVINGRTIIAKGGRGALVGPSGTPLVGPRGGYGGSGGDVHVEGGAGGSILATTNLQACAGSGAVGILLNSHTLRAGGDVNSPGNNAYLSAGAGVAGRGGDATGTNLSFPGGGGSGGPGLAAFSAFGAPGPNVLGMLTAASPPALVTALAARWGFDTFGSGGASGISAGVAAAYDAGPGGGGAASQQVVSHVDPGIFGGPGAVTGSANPLNRRDGNFGAGGSVINTGSGNTRSGAGAAGLVIFILREA